MIFLFPPSPPSQPVFLAAEGRTVPFVSKLLGNCSINLSPPPASEFCITNRFIDDVNDNHNKASVHSEQRMHECLWDLWCSALL